MGVSKGDGQEREASSDRTLGYIESMAWDMIVRGVERDESDAVKTAGYVLLKNKKVREALVARYGEYSGFNTAFSSFLASLMISLNQSLKLPPPRLQRQISVVITGVDSGKGTVTFAVKRVSRRSEYSTSVELPVDLIYEAVYSDEAWGRLYGQLRVTLKAIGVRPGREAVLTLVGKIVNQIVEFIVAKCREFNWLWRVVF
jgi:hypothetical protein